jgi:hypothetical protein
MARLPSEQYLMQQIGAQVVLFEDFTERQVVRFDPADGIAAANALDVIQASELGDEDKCYACFWAGYFHAYADRSPELDRETYVTEVDEGRAVVVLDAGTDIVRFDPRDANAAAKAQYGVYLSENLSQHEKNRAHFWCGFFYAQANQGGA